MGRPNGVQMKFSSFNFPETKLSDPMVSTPKKAYAYKSSIAQISFTWFNSVLNIMGGKASTVLKLATRIATHASFLLSEFFYMQILFIPIYIFISRMYEEWPTSRSRLIGR